MTGSKENIATIDEYISAYPEHVRQRLELLRKTISDLAPGVSETISYGIPTFKLNGNLVHFAAYKNHIGFYPTPSALQAFKDELDTYETSKGTVKFPLDEPLPLDLIKKIVEFRVKENLSR